MSTLVRVLLACTLVAGDVVAASRTTRVSASVVPYLTQSIDMPVSFSITDADRAAGFVDLRDLRIAVKTNDPAGYMIVFRFDSDDIELIEVRGLGEPVKVTRSGAFVLRRVDRIAPEVHELSCRVVFRKRVAAGTHDFPLRAAVHRLSL